MATATRQLAAIMFTDMVGYTTLMQQNETLALEKKDKFKRCFQESIPRHDGTIIQYYGDGVLSMFKSALQAVQSAIEIQTLYLREPRIDARIGIHVGEIMTDDTGAYGDGVNIASRVESLAVPGSIFISERLMDEIKNQQDIITRPLGYFDLKNIATPMQVYAIGNPGVIVPSRDEVRGKLKQSLNSIAVLPFASLSTDPENEYFCDGLTEELLNVLAQVEGFQVTARTSSFAFKGKLEDVREIAAKLNVQKIIEGSVRKAGNKVRITVQLINASDGYHLWSESYDRQLEDIFDVQDDISRTIANKLRANLAPSDHEKTLVTAPTANIEAYKKYLQGIHHWNRQTFEDFEKAIHCFHEAVALEPNFANPYYNIVYITSILPHIGMMSVTEARAICTAAADKAMECDPLNPWSILAKAITTFYFEWSFEKAEQLFLQAIQLNPNLTEAHFILGWYRMVMQQHDRLDEPLLNAYRLDPFGGETVPGICEVYLLAGMLDKAEIYIREALQNFPDSMYANTMHALFTGCKGDWNRACEIGDPYFLEEESFNLIGVLNAFAHARIGEPAKTHMLLENFIQRWESDNNAPVSHLIAILHLGLNDKEKFYTWYEKGLQEKNLSCLYFYNSPVFQAVNGEERMKQMRRKYGLPV